MLQKLQLAVRTLTTVTLHVDDLALRGNGAIIIQRIMEQSLSVIIPEVNRSALLCSRKKSGNQMQPK